MSSSHTEAPATATFGLVRPVAALAGLGLLLRLLVFVAGPAADIERAKTEDSGEYITLADNLGRCGVFGKDAESGTFLRIMLGWREASGTVAQRLDCGLRPESFRTPGYPAFIFLTSLGGRVLHGTLLLQLLLGASGVFLASAVASRLGLSRRAALLVGGLWAVHPALLLFDNLLLSESLFNWLIAVSLWFATGTATLPAALGWGATLGLASLVRPPLGLVFLPTACLWACAAAWPKRLLAVSIGLSLAIPSIWVVRNHTVGEGLRLSTSSEATLIFYAAPCVRADAGGRECDSSRNDDLIETDRRLRSVLQRGDDPMSTARSQAIDDVIAHPAATIRVQLRSWIKLAVAHSMGAFSTLLGLEYQSSNLFSALVLREEGAGRTAFSSSLWLALAWSLFNLLIFVAAIAGAVGGALRRRWLPVGGMVLASLLLAATVGSLGQERLRVPMLLPLFLLAGEASHWLRGWRVSR